MPNSDIDFTLSNARRFYLSMGDPLGTKRLTIKLSKILHNNILVHSITWFIGETEGLEDEDGNGGVNNLVSYYGPVGAPFLVRGTVTVSGILLPHCCLDLAVQDQVLVGLIVLCDWC